MRLLALALVAVTLMSCSDSSQDEPSPSTPPDLAETGVDACELLSGDEVADLAGGPVGSPEPALVGALPVCKWPMDDGGFVQVGSLSSSDWAQGLPQLLRGLEESGADIGADDQRRLRRMVNLVESGEVLTPTEACAAFSEMLELQGAPAGTPWIVNVFPNNQAPIALAGQMCSAGRFTTVTMANEEGLARPLPGGKVAHAVKLAHRRSLD